MNKSYAELSKLKTFKERFNYLKLDGSVGEDTFGYARYLNQKFYKSSRWQHTRDYIISRDNGCNLGATDHEILGEKILIHHINPITINDIMYDSPKLYDPNNLICVTKRTHDAIHYGSEDLVEVNDNPIIRTKDDTCLWKRR